MDEAQKTELIRLAGGRVRFNCPMARYTTFRVGGPVDALLEAGSVAELRRLVPFLKRARIPYLVVGRGSNLLVRDRGLEGVAILLTGSLARFREAAGPGVLAGAGLALARLLAHCRERGLGGLEFLAGIPGSVGGAVAMNAGAFGGEIADRISRIRIVTPEGGVVGMARSRLDFSYRGLRIPGGSVIVEAGFDLVRDNGHAVGERMSEYLERRRATQPLEYPSAGSVFRNPGGAAAGRLIERAGLKGERIGGAMISEKHANFIVNTGGATAGDILALVYMIRERVREETGVQLEPEIRVVGR